MKIKRNELECIEDCALKYKYKFIDKKICANNEMSDERYLILYSSVINSIELVNKKILQKLIDSPVEIIDNLIELFEKFWNDKCLNKKDDKEFYDNGITMLNNYVDIFMPENLQEFKNKEFIELVYGPFTFYSVVNRVDKLNGQDKYDFIIYKTGKLPGYTQSLVWNMQTILLILALENSPKYHNAVNNISYFYLLPGKKINIKIKKEKLKNYEIRLKEDIIKIINLKDKYWESFSKEYILPDKKNDDYIFMTPDLFLSAVDNENELANRTGGCRFCDYYNECPAWKIKPFEFNKETPEDFSKRYTLSYSKYSSYLDCPRLWKTRYLDRYPGKPKPYFDLGHSVHETLEIFYNPLNKKERSKDYLFKIYDRIFKKFADGYKTPEEKEEYFKQGLDMLEKYYLKYCEVNTFKPAEYVEYYFVLPMGKNIIMNGYVDRIDKTDENELIIIDYKTEPSMRSQEEVNKDKQLAIYNYSVSKCLNKPVKELKLLMMKFDKEIVMKKSDFDVNDLICEMDEKVIEIQEKSQNYLDKKVKGETDLFPPKKNKYCLGCDILSTCPLKDEILSDNTLMDLKS